MAPKPFIFGLISLCLMTDCSNGNESCVASIVGSCPPAWSKWEDKCYNITKSLTWFEAREECIKMESVLVVPQSQEETEFLKSMKKKFWINCNDLLKEGSWECQEGTTDVEYNWAPNEPNNWHPSTKETEHCAMIPAWIPSGQWNDFPCDRQLPAICKQPVPPQLHFN